MSDEKLPQGEISRRKFVTGALGVTAGVGVLSLASVVGALKPAKRPPTAEQKPPAAGDVLVYAGGTNKDQPIKVADLKADGLMVKAWPKGEVLKDKNDNNLLILFRYADGVLKEPAKVEDTVQGVIVYGGICQHLGCQVNQKDDGTLLCPCHSGAYDPRAGGEVIGGPPPRPLAQLPVEEKDGVLVVKEYYVRPRYGESVADWQTNRADASKGGA
ncbi:QcrA and Rieske domain-containing protein [Deinococcus roseus]|uniref:Rieske domain-containing protein n=1 Tax=Deinococcus roseus TaxID=392414 RepID=A0ABQ2CYY3_9DEIO|nr:ubiquinol-cytochrome c reductase iron-sulfur subunit [Deinococcus roseus]GGJ34458.1 hypothetical protein GCM10008938_20840 [Deinococcus roseus]